MASNVGVEMGDLKYFKTVGLVPTGLAVYLESEYTKPRQGIQDRGYFTLREFFNVYAFAVYLYLANLTFKRFLTMPFWLALIFAYATIKYCFHFLFGRWVAVRSVCFTKHSLIRYSGNKLITKTQHRRCVEHLHESKQYTYDHAMSSSLGFHYYKYI